MSDWRDIKTLPDEVADLPEDGIIFWNTCDGVHFVHPCQYFDDWWWHALTINPESELHHMFSHWMPAPDGPEVKSHLKLVS